MICDIDVLIFIEHKDRELQSAIFLKECLQKNYSFVVEIRSLVFDLWKTIFHFRPKYIILPYCRWEKTSAVALFRFVYGNSITFVNLNYEQICNPNLNEEKKPRDLFACNELIYTCWGQNSKDFFSNCGVPDKHLFITGKLETYILNKMIFLDRSKQRAEISSRYPKLRNKKIWIFIPMDDNWVFLNDLTEKFYQKGTWTKDKVVEYKSYLTDTVFMLLEWICQLDSDGIDKSNLQIIIRPHPGVSISYYEEYFNSKIGYIPDYIYITKEYTAKEWIAVCDKCISNYSTLLLDSSYIGVPSGLIRKEKIPESIKMEWFDEIYKIESYTSFCEYLFKIGETKMFNRCLEKYIDTSKNPVDEMQKIFEKDKNKPVVNNRYLWWGELLFYRMKYFAPSLLRSIALKLNLNIFGLKRLKFDYITEIEIIEAGKYLSNWFDI